MTETAKRVLKPLYYFAFFEALIFWYAIEKLLWDSSGINPEQIVILGIIAQSSQILIEVPSSIIADRWSRRKTLITSSVFMLIAIIIALSIQNFYSFAAMSLAWAFYFSFQSGTINAYIFDLLKEQGEQAQYRKAISRFATIQLSGLVVSSLAASILIEVGDYLTPYWATIIPTIVAIMILWGMHDPHVERTEQSSGSVNHHVKSAIKNVTGKKWLRLIFIALALVTAGRFIWYEYYQLYALKQEVAAVLFGITFALILIGNIAGSEFAHRLKKPNDVLLVSLALLVVSTISLAFVSSSVAIIVFLVACFFGSQASTIVLDESLQHETDSELRATTLSIASLLSRLFFGIGAVIIIVYDTSPQAIALVTLVLFTCMLIYLPARKHLVAAE